MLGHDTALISSPKNARDVIDLLSDSNSKLEKLIPSISAWILLMPFGMDFRVPLSIEAPSHFCLRKTYASSMCQRVFFGRWQSTRQCFRAWSSSFPAKASQPNGAWNCLLRRAVVTHHATANTQRIGGCVQ